jgi:CSLREA domain-containing protein
MSSGRSALFALVVVLALALPALAGAATFTVTASDDNDDGVCDVAHCSLREALNAANAAAGHDVIAFAIGTGHQTITPLSPLPTASAPLDVDGTSQPGYAGSPLIELDGSLAHGDGLVLAGDDSLLRGLVVNRFPAPYRAVVVEGAGSRVEEDYIGTDALGSVASPNDVGLEDHGTGTVVSGNLVSGNATGIALQGAGAIVQTNLVGTDASGTLAVPNGIGIQVNSQGAPASGNRIGGTGAGAGNVVSGNNIGIDLLFATGTLVQGNLIGTGADGSLPLGNRSDGVRIFLSDGNSIGGDSPEDGNVIANSFPGYGVDVQSGVRNSILGNSMHGNAAGIRLGTVGAVNDPGDADTGPNQGQNHPVLGPVTRGGGSTTIEGSLDSHALTTYRVEFFECDGTSGGDGRRLLGVRDVTTDASGLATFSFAFGEEATLVTSTATDPDGNTSEFGGCTDSHLALPVAEVTLTPAAAVNEVGTTHTVTAHVATVETSPHPLSGVTVRFTVQGAVNTSGSCVTGAAGDCSFTYSGPFAPGSDLISAYPDRNTNGVQDANEIGGGATNVWTAPTITAGQVTGGGQTQNFGGDDVLAFGFTAQSDGLVAKGSCSAEDRASGTSIRCNNVSSLTVTGTHAVIRGTGTINGLAMHFRIDADDNCNSGAGCDTFTIQTDTGYSAGGVLQRGNIEVHA